MHQCDGVYTVSNSAMRVASCTYRDLQGCESFGKYSLEKSLLDASTSSHSSSSSIPLQCHHRQQKISLLLVALSPIQRCTPSACDTRSCINSIGVTIPSLQGPNTCPKYTSAHSRFFCRTEHTCFELRLLLCLCYLPRYPHIHLSVCNTTPCTTPTRRA